jgi:hypothetical protein
MKKSKLMDRVRAAMRVRHYSIRTEQAYFGWMCHFILVHNKNNPDYRGAGQVAQFLNH